MTTEKIENNDPNEFIDPIGDLRRSLNQEMLEREDFHKFYTKLKNLPMFFEIAKKRTEQ
jgi:hypothetical protein